MRINVRPDLDFIPNSEFRIPHSRKGVTLTEVLIAMFVLAIGMMGVLALFPLGAAQMANAVKDERCLQTAQIVEGNMRIWWRNAYPTSSTPDFPPYVPNNPAFTTEPGLQAFDNPDPACESSAMSAAQIQVGISPTSTEASFPIYLDPIGRAVQPGNSGPWVGGISTPATPTMAPLGLPRRTIKAISLLPAAQATTARIRGFALIDDLNFTQQGLANPVNRAGRYSAAVLLQRSSNGGGTNNTKANMTIVVYQNRPIADTPSTETVLGTGALVPGTTTVSFAKAGLPSASLRKGGWILITGQTTLPMPGVINGPPNPLHPIYPFANFYRIVSVQDNGVNFALEVSPPLKENRPPERYWPIPPPTSYTGTIIAMENVVEVFDRPPLLPGN